MTKLGLYLTAFAGFFVITGSACAEPVGAGVRFAGADGPLQGVLYRPAEAGPFPAVIALHGCGGLNLKPGGRELDWAQRLAGAGFTVLFPDSFRSRGLGSQCRVRKRAVRAGKERIADAHSALAYLQTRTDIKAGSITLLGWSNGGATVINSVPRRRRPDGLRYDFAAAIGFYPGCRAAERRKQWDTRIRLLILTGLADDWTPPGPCMALAKRAKAAGDRIEIVLYPGAYHDFDHPDMPLRTRKGRAYSAEGSGLVHQGTDPAARADAIARVMRFLPR
ncbi:MAG: dienelactone hydrolase family protein [Beijerinckiaceae bacterium]